MYSTKDFGQAVAFLADKAGKNQKQLAGELGITDQTVTNWKRGQDPMTRNVDKLPAILGCSMAEIEEVATYHYLWRERMKTRRAQAQASEVADGPSAQHQVSIEQMEQEIVRNATLTFSQVLVWHRCLATGAPDSFPVHFPALPTERTRAPRRKKPRPSAPRRSAPT